MQEFNHISLSDTCWQSHGYVCMQWEKLQIDVKKVKNKEE